MNELSLTIYTEENQFLKAIEFNYEELKKTLETYIDKYKNLLVTEDKIQDAKKDRAELNKLIKHFEDERKKVKKKCLEPYEKFETKIKDLVGLVKKPVSQIDHQIKTFEDNKKEKKYQEIFNYWEDNIDYISIDYVSFEEHVFNPKWTNTTYNIEDIKNEIDQFISKLKNDLQVIEKMETPYKVQILDKYKKTQDLGAAISENNRLIEIENNERQRQEKEQAKKQAEEERQRQEARKQQTEDTPPEKPPEQLSQKNILSFKCIVNEEEKDKIIAFLKSNEIDHIITEETK